MQSIALSLLTTYIDYKLGWKAWSINIAIPIMIIIANITMMMLTIISHKKYIKYAIYQLIIVVLSILPTILNQENMKSLSIVANCICFVNFVLCLGLATKDIKEAIIRKFHV